MNAQAQLSPQPDITFTVSVYAAKTILEGLAHLPIRLAGDMYVALEAEINKAEARAVASQAPASPASPDNNQQPHQETQQT